MIDPGAVMRRFSMEPADDAIRLPRPQEPQANPNSFALMPMALLGGLTPDRAALYQLAFEQARQAARPSLPERDLAGVWN